VVPQGNKATAHPDWVARTRIEVAWSPSIPSSSRNRHRSSADRIDLLLDGSNMLRNEELLTVISAGPDDRAADGDQDFARADLGL